MGVCLFFSASKCILVPTESYSSLKGSSTDEPNYWLAILLGEQDSGMKY